MLDYSIGEADSLVLKAYRGAGFSWGVAQEAGHTVAWLATRGLPALDEFALLLRKTDQQSISTLTPDVNNKACWSGSSGKLCPVLTGLAFSESNFDDFDLEHGLSIKAVHQPIILVPFIAHSAKELQCDLMLRVQAEQVICTKEGSVFYRADNADSRSLCCDVGILHAHGAAPAETGLRQRAPATPQSVDLLNSLAHRTYVPATEESRQGAGAGLLDND